MSRPRNNRCSGLSRALREARDSVAENPRSYLGIAEVMRAFFVERVSRTLAAFGDDPWPYGIESNRPTLEAAVRYPYEPPLPARRASIDELFPPNLVASHV